MTLDFNKLIYVSGINDLFLLLNAQTDNLVLKSLKDNTTVAYSISRSKVMNLNNIQVYTLENSAIDLLELLKSLRALPFEDIAPKDNKEKYYEYFLKACPQLDLERVFINNLKLIYKWHKILKDYTI